MNSAGPHPTRLVAGGGLLAGFLLSLMDSAASSKRKRAGSIPAESTHAAFDYWLGREVLNLEERDRYSHAVPTEEPTGDEPRGVGPR